MFARVHAGYGKASGKQMVYPPRLPTQHIFCIAFRLKIGSFSYMSLLLRRWTSPRDRCWRLLDRMGCQLPHIKTVPRRNCSRWHPRTSWQNCAWQGHKLRYERLQRRYITTSRLKKTNVKQWTESLNAPVEGGPISGFTCTKPVTDSIASLPKHHASLSKVTSLSQSFFRILLVGEEELREIIYPWTRQLPYRSRSSVASERRCWYFS